MMRVRIFPVMKTAHILKHLMQTHQENAYHLAERSGDPQPTIQRILSGKHAEPRSSTLRRLAVCYGLTESHLRGDLAYTVVSSADVETVNVQALEKPYLDAVHIPLMERFQGMLSQDVARVVLQQAFLERHSFLNRDSLRVFCVSDHDMAPTFEYGDCLLVDASIHEMSGDGVYVLEVRQQMLLRRLRRRLDGEWELSCDNPSIKSVDLLSQSRGVAFLGRVLWSWHGKKVV